MFKAIKNYIRLWRKRRFILKSYRAYSKHPCTTQTVSPLYFAINDYEDFMRAISRKPEEQQE